MKHRDDDYTKRRPGRREKALKGVAITNAMVSAISASNIRNLEGGEIAVGVLEHLNDKFHNDLLASLPEDASDKDWDVAMKVCSTDACTTTQYMKTITSYEDCAAAARVIGIMQSELETALGRLTYRAAEIDPDRMALDQTKLLQKQLANLLGNGVGMEAVEVPGFIPDNRDLPVS